VSVDLTQLDERGLHQVAGLFTAPHQGYIVRSALAGNTRLRAWSDGRAALAWDGSHGISLGGDPHSPAFLAALPGLLAELRAEAEAAGLRWFKFTPSHDAWLPVLEATLSGAARAGRTLLRRDPGQEGPVGDPPASYQCWPITADLLERDTSGSRAMREEVASMWGEPAAFLERGFGYAALADDEVVGWCTVEYLSEGACGIGIETVEAHQRRGVATALARLTGAECARRGLTAHWDSWTRNTPSVRSGLKAGFRPVCEYTVLFAERFPSVLIP
jgi:GNAT superfamily N-acetyltransferase